MNLVDALSLTERIGFPALFLILLCFALYKIGRWIGKKLDPFFDQLTELLADHKTLISEIKIHIKKNDEIMSKQVEITQEQLSDLTVKLTTLTELAIERNNYIRDTQSIYKYMNTEINHNIPTNIFDL